MATGLGLESQDMAADVDMFICDEAAVSTSSDSETEEETSSSSTSSSHEQSEEGYIEDWDLERATENLLPISKAVIACEEEKADEEKESAYGMGFGLFERNLNPSRAKFFRENINIYLHFMSFLHINKTGSSNSWLSKTRTCLFYIINIMAAEVLATPSETMILT